jgi:hypothetical protein
MKHEVLKCSEGHLLKKMTEKELEDQGEVECTRCHQVKHKASFLECKECVNFIHARCAELMLIKSPVVWCGTGKHQCQFSDGRRNFKCYSCGNSPSLGMYFCEKEKC